MHESPLYRIVASLLLVLWLGSRCIGADADEDFFELKVRPLLVQRCFGCHGDRKQESDLRLDSRALILQGGATGDAVVVPGDPDDSLLIQYVRGDVDGMEMPPDEPLSPEEIAILHRWVKQGMVWPAEDSNAPKVLTIEERLEQDRSQHWAFQPPETARPDRVDWPAELRDWPATRLDEYVLDTLLQNQMLPSPAADARTLLRRLKFDLLGLPPTQTEIEAFLADDSPDAWTQLVERMLASPQFGERWGRHWLDVARYADTRGYTFGGADRNYKWAYTYRDYVIEAWNDDVPFDQFVLQQMAADQLEQGDDNRSLAALGYLTVGRKFNNTHDDIDDRIDAVTSGFLGLTVACARCHDHKYDAIPTEDYYSLYGVFSSSYEPGTLPLIGDAATLDRNREYEQRFNDANGKLNEYQQQLVRELSTHVQERIADYLVATVDDDPSNLDGLREPMVRAWKRLLRRKAKLDEPTLMPWAKLDDVADEEFYSAATELASLIEGESGDFLNPFVRKAFIASPPRTRVEMAQLYGRVLQQALTVWKEAGGDGRARREQSAEVRQLLWYFSDGNSPGKIETNKIQAYLTDAEKQQREQLKSDVDLVRKTMPASYRRAMVMLDRDNPSDARVLIRGSASRPGDTVPRQTPALVSPAGQQPYEGGSGRLQLARDIIDARNPLTARVIVNRVWMHHFGRPLVDTPSDFGIRCDEPVQRRVLDYLAIGLMQHDWSLKWLHREILLSATWRQASAGHPDYSIRDPENRLLWRANRRRLEFEALRDSLLFVAGQLETDFGGESVRMFRDPEGGSRRSVYGYIDRQDLPNLLRVFDFAGPDQSAAKRASTTVPQQALFMLNSRFVLRLARDLVASISAADDERFISVAYQRLFSRSPTPDERRIAIEFLASEVDSQAKLSSREQLAQLLLLTNEFCHVD